MKKWIVVLIVAVAVIAAFVAGIIAKTGYDHIKYEIKQGIVVNGNQQKTDKPVFITEEAAKKIALEKAGLTADQVKFVKVELDRDVGITKYEVEFRKDHIEYEADINAETGEIIKWNKDLFD